MSDTDFPTHPGYYYQVFEELFAAKKVRKKEVDSDSSLIQMLLSKRVSAIFMDSYVFHYTCKKMKVDEKKMSRVYQLSTAPVGLKLRIEKKEKVSKLNEAIATMKNDGTIDRIIEKYTN